MGEITVTIDGQTVTCTSDISILEAARRVGIEIPTLCHHPNLSPDGSCRICVVEVEGSPTLVGSCHTPIRSGMVIHTKSKRVIRSRRLIIELLMAGHTGPCVTDARANECELHQLASRLEIGSPRFHIQSPRSYPIEDVSPYVHRDMSRCILCNRCIYACRDIAQQCLFDKSYRGFDAKITVGLDEALNHEVCKDCQICVDYCPTSALLRPGDRHDQ
jgi:NADH dehydrogenase/NADH:ubiquinone oxidoreductase subunit G